VAEAARRSLPGDAIPFDKDNPLSRSRPLVSHGTSSSRSIRVNNARLINEQRARANNRGLGGG